MKYDQSWKLITVYSIRYTYNDISQPERPLRMHWQLAEDMSD